MAHADAVVDLTLSRDARQQQRVGWARPADRCCGPIIMLRMGERCSPAAAAASAGAAARNEGRPQNQTLALLPGMRAGMASAAPQQQ